MIGIVPIFALVLFGYHVHGTVHLTSNRPLSHENVLAQNHVKVDSLVTQGRDLHLPNIAPRVSVGEEVIFESIVGDLIYGAIDSVSSHGASTVVYSGSTQDGGTFHLSYSNGVIIGEVHSLTDDVKYQLRPKDLSSNLYTMQVLPRSVYDRDDSPEDTDPSLEIDGEAAELRRQQIHQLQQGLPHTAATAASEPVGEDYNSALYSSNILDVMFIFTPQALASVGGSQSSMEALAALSVQLANEAYANSQLPIRMRCVSVAALKDTTYVQKGFATELNRLRYDHDAFFDDEVNIRSSVGADAVVMFTSDTTYCGLSYMWATADLAFAVVSTQCPLSVVHEVGHTIGCDHDRFTVHDYDYSHYNLGFCWDTSARTCSRSVMAYAGCVTPGKRTNCPRASYFSSPLVTQGNLRSTTGIATSDNARVIREQLPRIVAWRRARTPGGIISSVQPSGIAVGRCQPVVIKGFRIATASSTIISVTLNGVPVQKILSQSLDAVEVLAGLSDVPGTGGIVVTTSSGYTTTLAGAFTYEATSGSFLTDFDAGLGTMWSSTGAADWSVLRYCDSLPCSATPISGPLVGASGSGNFLKIQSFEASNDDAELTAYFNEDVSGGCIESVTSLSLYYHLWGPHSDLCRGSLVVTMQSVGSSAWTTILTATEVQARQDDPWLHLQFAFPNPTAVAAIRITAVPYSGQASCYYWGSVSVDEISVTKTTACSKDNCDFISAAPTIAATAAPTARPTTARPSTIRPTTMRPTAARSPAPTVLVEVLEIVRFDCSQTLTGVTVEKFLAQPSNTDNFLAAAAKKLNVDVDSLCCAVVVSDTGTRRLSLDGSDGLVAAGDKDKHLAATSGIAITYRVELQVQYQQASIGTNSGDESSVLSAAALAKVDTAKQALTDSVSSGAFLTALKQVLSAEVVSADLSVAPVSSASFSAPVSLIVEMTASPTMAPTMGARSASSAGFTWGVIAYVVLAVISLVTGSSGYAFYVYCWKPEQEKRKLKIESLAERANHRKADANQADFAATYDQLMGDHQGTQEGEENVRAAVPDLVRTESSRSNSQKDGRSPRAVRATSNADTVIPGYRPASGRQPSLDLRPLALPRTPKSPYSGEQPGVELSDVMASRRAAWVDLGVPVAYTPTGQNSRPPNRGAYQPVYAVPYPSVDHEGWETIPPELLMPPDQPPQGQWHDQIPSQPQPQQAHMEPEIESRMMPRFASSGIFPPQISVQIADPSAAYQYKPRPKVPPSAASTPASTRSSATAVYSYGYNSQEYYDPQAVSRQSSRDSGDFAGPTPRYGLQGGSPRSSAPLVVVQGRRRTSGLTEGGPQPPVLPTPPASRSYDSRQRDLRSPSHEEAQYCNSLSYSHDLYASPQSVIPSASLDRRSTQDGYGAYRQSGSYRSTSGSTKRSSGVYEPGQFPTIWLGDPQIERSLSTDTADTRAPSLYNHHLAASHDTVEYNGAPRSVAPSPRFQSHYNRNSRKAQPVHMAVVAEDDGTY